MALRTRTLLQSSFLALALAAPWLAGCGAHGGVRPAAANAERASPASSSVGDDGFALAVHDLLLSEPGSAERHMRLGAVESRQMTRAAERFRARQADRGLAAVSGALYLLHVGEASEGVFGAQGVEALGGASRELALKGDEGRSRAVYDLLLRIAPPSERGEVLAHLGALDRWTKDAVATGGPLESLGGLERVAIHRRMLEPSPDALADAANDTSDWIRQAVDLRERF